MNINGFKTATLAKQDSFAYFGDHDLSVWGFTPFARTRDSDTLTASNWEVISTDLKTRFPDAFDVLQASHWAYGWIDQLMIDTGNEDALRAAFDWAQRLEDYPVADDDDYSSKQYAEYEAAYDQWAKYDLAYHLRASDITTFGTEREWFEPTPEQEDFLRSWVIDRLEYSGGDGIRQSDYDGIEEAYSQWLVGKALIEGAEAGQGALAI